jgi:hypothetical protein
MTARKKNLKEASRVLDLFALALQLVEDNAPTSLALASLPTPEEIEQDFMRAVLEEDEEDRELGDARRHLQTAEERAQWPLLDDVRVSLRFHGA